MAEIGFFQAFGTAVLIVLMIGAIIYWVRVYFKKAKYFWKYKVFKKKHDPVQVEIVAKFQEEEKTADEMEKSLILSGITDMEEIKELRYIYKELSSLKGGKKK